MSYRFSDHFGTPDLASNIDSTQTTITLTDLDPAFADDVRAGGKFPLRLGGKQRATHERVLCTGIADEANDKITVERGVLFGAESHAAGTRVAHALPAWHASKVAGLPEAQGVQDNEIQVLRAALSQLNISWTTSTKDGDSNTYQISHSLGVVPDIALIIPASDDAANKEYYVSSKGSSNIEITFVQTPNTGTGNLQFEVLVAST